MRNEVDLILSGVWFLVMSGALMLMLYLMVYKLKGDGE